ncbi:MAG: aconitase X [Paracoccus sp. (in: a-proteobacteria)]|nr:aconitase X [Paracoccus sp. (in: a-proteobacteria)]
MTPTGPPHTARPPAGAAARQILPGRARGPVVAMAQGLSFWGGVDPATARVIDTHHPAHGAELAGAVVVMPTSRGSCSGSGIILDLLMNDRAPAALIFSEAEDILTLGAMIAAELFARPMPVLRVTPDMLAALSHEEVITITDQMIEAGDIRIPITATPGGGLELSERDREILDGRDGEAAALAMRIVTAMARQQDAARLTDIARGHIDGCLLSQMANLIFAEKMALMGARVRVPTTINAISVDRRNWQAQGVPLLFGDRASRLADAYVAMGCRPTFTCAPYLLDDRPAPGESIAWAESNAVVFANSVLGARTAKHPDYLDLCIAMTGRAPLSGVYLDAGRKAQIVLDFDIPPGADDLLWPLVGYLAGLRSPDRIPLIRGLEGLAPGHDDLKALCAAFGTTSAAPMLHIAGITPEAAGAADPQAGRIALTPGDLAAAWDELNRGPVRVDLIAIGSPHASAAECRALAAALGGATVMVPTIVTAGRQIIAEIGADGTLGRLIASGVQVIADLCWCSISQPVFPPEARAVMTNSGKYAHYGPGLSGCGLRLGSLRDCVSAAISGQAPAARPVWLSSPPPER